MELRKEGVLPEHKAGLDNHGNESPPGLENPDTNAKLLPLHTLMVDACDRCRRRLLDYLRPVLPPNTTLSIVDFVTGTGRVVSSTYTHKIVLQKALSRDGLEQTGGGLQFPWTPQNVVILKRLLPLGGQSRITTTSNRKLDFKPKDVILFRSRLLEHFITDFEGERSKVFFTR